MSSPQRTISRKAAYWRAQGVAANGGTPPVRIAVAAPTERAVVVHDQPVGRARGLGGAVERDREVGDVVADVGDVGVGDRAVGQAAEEAAHRLVADERAGADGLDDGMWLIVLGHLLEAAAV